MGELPTEAELLVIGGGPGGYAAAFRAADLGLDVTLVSDEEHLGGVCLLRGCIPSKLMLELAGLRLAAAAAAEHGLRFGEPEQDLEAMRSWKDEVVGRLSHGLDALCKARGIHRIQGRAHFAGPDRVHIEDSDTPSVSFRHAIIATGSRPKSPPGLTIRPGSRIMDSTGALALEEIPETLLVIGGGYVGLELGLVYAGLGSRVTLVQSHERLLPPVDPDLVEILRERIGQHFEAVHYHTRATAMNEEDDGVSVTLEGNEGSREARFSRVLVAVGRQPNSNDLGLEQAGVKCDDHGAIIIDEQCRTSAENIYAVGDVAGGIQLAHKAMYEGKVAAEVIAGRPAAADARAIPSVVYTEPQIAWCGIGEKEAGEGIRTVRYPWKANGRALTLDAAYGLTKLLVEEESGRLLGMGVVGPQAENLIAEGALAIELGAVAEDIALTVHAHPTLSETVGEAAELFLGLATHLRK
jgi:dihydrolipoamide dehydrogenase